MSIAESEKDGDTVTKGSNVSRQFFLVAGNFSWLDKFFPNFQRFFKIRPAKNHRKCYKSFLPENEFVLKNFLQKIFPLGKFSFKKNFLHEKFLAKKISHRKNFLQEKTLGHWKYFLPLPEKFLQEEFPNFIT